MPERLTAHLRDCPSCSEVVSLQRQQPGSVQDQGWFERFRYMDGGRLVEEAVASPGVAELWLSAGSWRFHDTEYKPPERSLVLVLSDAISHESEEPSWFDVAPVRTDVEVALPTDFLVTADESSYGCPLRVVLSMECKVERRHWSPVSAHWRMLTLSSLRSARGMQSGGGEIRLRVPKILVSRGRRASWRLSMPSVGRGCSFSMAFAMSRPAIP